MDNSLKINLSAGMDSLQQNQDGTYKGGFTVLSPTGRTPGNDQPYDKTNTKNCGKTNNPSCENTECPSSENGGCRNTICPDTKIGLTATSQPAQRS